MCDGCKLLRSQFTKLFHVFKKFSHYIRAVGYRKNVLSRSFGKNVDYSLSVLIKSRFKHQKFIYFYYNVTFLNISGYVLCVTSSHTVCICVLFSETFFIVTSSCLSFLFQSFIYFLFFQSHKNTYFLFIFLVIFFILSLSTFYFFNIILVITFLTLFLI